MIDIFEKYLTYRFQRAGAVTPGQKLDVLREVRADAERFGCVVTNRVQY